MGQVEELIQPPAPVRTVTVRVLKRFRYARQRMRGDNTLVNQEPIRWVEPGEVLEGVLQPFAEGLVARGRAELC